MKISFWILLFLLVAIPVTIFLWQRWRQKRAEREGVVVYATVVSMEPVKVFGKYSDMMKINLWVQEPGSTTRREVSLQSRIPAGQKIEPGMMLPVVIDPKDPKRIYPASEESAKRLVVTGSREQRRQIKKGKVKRY